MLGLGEPFGERKGTGAWPWTLGPLAGLRGDLAPEKRAACFPSRYSVLGFEFKRQEARVQHPLTTTPPPRPWPSESYNLSKSHLLPPGHIPTKAFGFSDSEGLADETCPRSLCFTVCLIKARLGFKASRQLGGPGLRSTLPDYTLALRPGSPWGGCSQGHTTGCHAPGPRAWPISHRRRSTRDRLWPH